MDQKLLLGGPLGYAGSAYETFQTVSQGGFSETPIYTLGCLCVRTEARGRFLARGEISTKHLTLGKRNLESRRADSNR